MRQNNARPKPLGKVMRYALGQPPGVDENQRRAPLADQLRQAIVDFVPHLVARHRAQLALGNFDEQVHFAAVSHREHARVFAQEAGHRFDRLDGGGEADALQPAPRQPVEPRQAERQVRAALIVDYGVNLVDDHRAGGTQHLPALFGGEQDE